MMILMYEFITMGVFVIYVKRFEIRLTADVLSQSVLVDTIG